MEKVLTSAFPFSVPLSSKMSPGVCFQTSTLFLGLFFFLCFLSESAAGLSLPLWSFTGRDPGGRHGVFPEPLQAKEALPDKTWMKRIVKAEQFARLTQPLALSLPSGFRGNPAQSVRMLVYSVVFCLWAEHVNFDLHVFMMIDYQTPCFAEANTPWTFYFYFWRGNITSVL